MKKRNEEGENGEEEEKCRESERKWNRKRNENNGVTWRNEMILIMMKPMTIDNQYVVMILMKKNEITKW